MATGTPAEPAPAARERVAARVAPARADAPDASGAAPGPVPGGQPTRVPGAGPGRRPSRRFILGKAVREFFADECWDRAAALTFFGVLSVPPLAIAVVTVLVLLGQGEAGTEAVLEILRQLTPDDEALESVADPVLAVLSQPVAGATVVVGVATGLWMASGYVGGFGRAMNRIYGVDEGRPFLALIGWHLLTTVMLVGFGILVALMLVVSGPVTHAVGAALDLGEVVVVVWEAARWPVLLLAAILVVAVLYYATPNVAHARFRWISPGAVVALGIAAVASYGFSFWVGLVGRFDVTYGRALAGIVVFFIWLWIINMSLLFGAELDSEIERARQLVAGMRAERAVQVARRDTRASERATARREADVARARSLRASHGWEDDGAE